MSLKKIFYSLILLISISNSNLQAQIPTFDWAKEDYNYGNASVVTGNDGSIYSVGFDGIYISKIDSNGVLIWKKQFFGTNYTEGRSIALDHFGNLIVTGFFSGDTLDFDAGPNVFDVINAGSEGTVILKLSSNGDFIWAKGLSSTGENYPYSITVDNDNNIITTGKFVGVADFNPNNGMDTISSIGNDIYIWKIDSNGNEIWHKEIPAINSRANSVGIDQQNNIYLSGKMVDNNNFNDFDPSINTAFLTLPSTNLGTHFILKLNSLGNFQWVKQIDNLDLHESNRQIQVDNLGNVYLGGLFFNTTDFDPNIGVHSLTADTIIGNYFLLQLDKDGNFNWVNKLNDVYGITLDVQQNIYAYGTEINKFNSSGISQWRFDNPQTYLMAVYSTENLYLFGTYNGITDFDPSTNVFDLPDTNGFIQNRFIQKLYLSFALGINELENQNSSIIAFPNPTNENIQINSLERINEIIVFNNLGQIISTTNPKQKNTTLKIENAGVNYLLIKTENKSNIIKVIKSP